MANKEKKNSLGIRVFRDLLVVILAVLIISLIYDFFHQQQLKKEKDSAPSITSNYNRDTTKRQHERDAIMSYMSDEARSYLASSDRGAITTSSGEKGISTNCRIVFEDAMPMVAESLTNATIKYAEEHNFNVHTISVKMYSDSSDGTTDSSSMISWISIDGGKSGTYTNRKTGESVEQTLNELYEKYNDFGK